MRVRNARGVFNVGGFTQNIPSEPCSYRQVPYLEQIISASGDEILTKGIEPTDKPELWQGDMRMAFFFHFLDFKRPLATPFGDVWLPAESELPNRLSMFQYYKP